MKLNNKQLDKICKKYRLSPRESQILKLILDGVDSNKEICVSEEDRQEYVVQVHGARSILRRRQGGISFQLEESTECKSDEKYNESTHHLQRRRETKPLLLAKEALYIRGEAQKGNCDSRKLHHGRSLSRQAVWIARKDDASDGKLNLKFLVPQRTLLSHRESRLRHYSISILETRNTHHPTTPSRLSPRR